MRLLCSKKCLTHDGGICKIRDVAYDNFTGEQGMSASKESRPKNMGADVGGRRPVLEAILGVMDELAKVGLAKQGVNKSQGWKFRSIDDLYGVLTPALVKNKLTIIPQVTSREETKYAGKGDSVTWHVVLKVDYMIMAVGGDCLVTSVYSEALDQSDKATNKAMSFAYKYMAFQVFGIPVEGQDDGDRDHIEVDTKVARAAARAKKLAEFSILADTIGVDIQALLERRGMSSTSEMSDEQLTTALEHLRSRVRSSEQLTTSPEHLRSSSSEGAVK